MPVLHGACWIFEHTVGEALSTQLTEVLSHFRFLFVSHRTVHWLVYVQTSVKTPDYFMELPSKPHKR